MDSKRVTFLVVLPSLAVYSFSIISRMRLTNICTLNIRKQDCMYELCMWHDVRYPNVYMVLLS